MRVPAGILRVNIPGLTSSLQRIVECRECRERKKSSYLSANFVMESNEEEFEPLFDYSRVQQNFVCIDDDGSSDSYPRLSPKRKKKTSDPDVEKKEISGNAIHVVDCDEKEDEDWLLPPPKVSNVAQKLEEDSTIKELRLKKQELALLAQSAKDLLHTVEESAKREFSSAQSALESVTSHPSKPSVERVKIIISIQEKDGLKQFRIFKDDKFERLFKMYAEKVSHDLQTLVFSFDGDKVAPTATPDGLGLDDGDIIEVNIRSS